MKTLFIPAKLKFKINKSNILKISKKLPENIAIAYSIQYKNQANEVKGILQKEHKITKFIQVLGCSKPKFSRSTQAILLISDGKFHAVSLAYETKIQVYLIEKNNLYKVSEKDIAKLEKRQKASYVKFLNSRKVGIFISTKPGQQRLKKALELKEKFKDKEYYFFIANNLSTAEFENFGLNCWVNSACPRLDLDDSRIINVNFISRI